MADNSMLYVYYILKDEDWIISIFHLIYISLQIGLNYVLIFLVGEREFSP